MNQSHYWAIVKFVEGKSVKRMIDCVIPSHPSAPEHKQMMQQWENIKGMPSVEWAQLRIDAGHLVDFVNKKR